MGLPKNVNPFKLLLAVVADATLSYTTKACSRIFSVFLAVMSKIGPYVANNPYRDNLSSAKTGMLIMSIRDGNVEASFSFHYLLL